MADLVQASAAWVRSPYYIDLTARQLALLGAICDRSGPHQVRELAKELGVSKPVITRAVNSLIKAGLVHRDRDVRDRRNRLIGPTAAGDTLRDQLAAL